MEGASSKLAGHLDDILPKEAQFVLDWNPPQFTTGQEARPSLPPTSMTYTTDIGYSRPAAFYDRHLAPHLILERVVYFGALVSTMANTVDQATQDAVNKRPLPKDTGELLLEKQIKYKVKNHYPSTNYRENGIAEAYKQASSYCLPIASTLAIHPSSEAWESILNWTTDGNLGRWAITDGVLRVRPGVFVDDQWMQQLLKNEDDEKKGILRNLAFRSTALGVWEMKSLTVGTAQVMEEIAEMGLTHAKFPWKKCTTLPVCDHQFWDRMEESRESYDAGVDPRSPPWTLPIVPSTSAADSRPTSLRKGLRSSSVLSYKERSLSPVEDDKGVTKKRRRNRSDASEYERPPSKKPKADSMDESYEPSPGARKEVNAQSFLQQVT